MNKGRRPAIFLKYLGEESLVWIGTTKMKKRPSDIPIEIKINDEKTFFYSKGIEKIETKYLIDEWIDENSNEIFRLTFDQEKQLISKFGNFTNQKNPYEIINSLENEIKKIKTEKEILKLNYDILSDENKILKTKTLNKMISEYEHEK